MANEAFALSPISARAASPTDADFEAIREAFLETARGRWFLDEYTRRNRNADTAMVLEAVARIESSLAAQKEEQQRQALSEPPLVEPPSNELPEAMAAVRAIVAAARVSASSVLAGPALEETLAPSRKCARVIREIAWGLRESGADGRICTLLDSQVDAINAACDQVAAGGLRDSVLHAFDQAALEIEGIVPSAIEPQAESKPVAAIHIVAPEAAQSALVSDEMFEAAIAAETSRLEPMAEVILPAEESLPAAVYALTDAEPVVTVHLEAAPEAMAEPVAEIVREPVASAAVSTLGESLIANGIIARPASPRSDPLAPIRRMSQAERIAFFS
ncbi:MAG: hypothetical protein ACRC9K_15310 [Afipia sp.]